MTLLPLLLLFTLSVNAQLKKGTIQLGTSTNLLGNLNQLGAGNMANNAGIQFGKNKRTVVSNGSTVFEREEKVRAFNLSPSIGFFLADNFMLGLSAGVFVYHEKDKTDDTFGYTALSFSPSLRGCFKKEGKSLPYGELRGGIVHLKIKDAEESDSAPFLGVKFGNAFFLNSNLSLDIFAEYVYGWNKTKDTSSIPNIETETTEKTGMIGIGVGFSYFLVKKEN